MNADLSATVVTLIDGPGFDLAQMAALIGCREERVIRHLPLASRPARFDCGSISERLTWRPGPIFDRGPALSWGCAGFPPVWAWSAVCPGSWPDATVDPDLLSRRTVRDLFDPAARGRALAKTMDRYRQRQAGMVARLAAEAEAADDVLRRSAIRRRVEEERAWISLALIAEAALTPARPPAHVTVATLAGMVPPDHQDMIAEVFEAEGAVA